MKNLSKMDRFSVSLLSYENFFLKTTEIVGITSLWNNQIFTEVNFRKLW